MKNYSLNELPRLHGGQQAWLELRLTDMAGGGESKRPTLIMMNKRGVKGKR